MHADHRVLSGLYARPCQGACEQIVDHIKAAGSQGGDRKTMHASFQSQSPEM